MTESGPGDSAQQQEEKQSDLKKRRRSVAENNPSKKAKTMNTTTSVITPTLRTVPVDTNIVTRACLSPSRGQEPGAGQSDTDHVLQIQTRVNPPPPIPKPTGAETRNKKKVKFKPQENNLHNYFIFKGKDDREQFQKKRGPP